MPPPGTQAVAGGTARSADTKPSADARLRMKPAAAARSAPKAKSSLEKVVTTGPAVRDHCGYDPVAGCRRAGVDPAAEQGYSFGDAGQSASGPTVSGPIRTGRAGHLHEDPVGVGAYGHPHRAGPGVPLGVRQAFGDDPAERRSGIHSGKITVANSA